MEGGDEMVDMRFLYETDLPSRAIYVYLYLVLRANREGQCWPAVPRIAADLKLSERTVQRALSDLREAGLIETEQRYRKNGAKSSNLFHIKKKQE